MSSNRVWAEACVVFVLFLFWLEVVVGSLVYLRLMIEIWNWLLPKWAAWWIVTHHVLIHIITVSKALFDIGKAIEGLYSMKF